jgi:hypothetical protein
MGESGGDTAIYNGTCCYGGYQFNTNTLARACATNPVCATRAAIKHSKNGHDWGIWEAFTDGSYQKYVGGSGFGKGKNRPPSKQGAAKLVDLELGPLHINTPGPNINPLAPFDPNKIAGDVTGKALEGVSGLNIPVLSDLAASLRNIAAFFRGIGELILTPAGWLRIGKLLGGVILLFWGLRIIIREATGTDPVKAATKTATKGAEVAALAATVK